MAFLSDYFNLAGNTASISGNITGGNVNSSGIISAGGNVYGANIAAANTLTVGGAILTADGNTIAVNGAPLVPATGNTSISTTGNVAAGNVTIDAGGNLTFGDGTKQTTAANYGNANVAAYLPTNTANVSADYFLGNGALLTGLPATYGNANVANYLANGSDPTITAITSNVANLQATAYGNSNVAAYLPTYTGTLSGNSVTLGTGNLLLRNNVIESTGTEITIDPVADGSPLTGNVLILGNLSVTGNTITTNPVINTTNALLWQAANNAANAISATGAGLAVGPVGNSYATFTFDATRTTWHSDLGIDVAGEVSATGNVTAPYFLGNGSQLTGMYGNAEVSNYLANGSNPTITALQTDTSNNTSNISTLQGNVTTLTSDLANTNSNVANLQASVYTDANVSAYLASGTDTANIITSGNVAGGYILGNGAFLTGIPAGYSNAEVSTYLASGNNTANIITTGNVSGDYILGNISQATGLGNVSTINLNGNATEVLSGAGTWIPQDASSYGNANVAAYLPTYSGNLGNVGIANTLGVLMGTPTQGNLISNAVSLTANTALTDSIALLNTVLGKLVPPAPPAFPASQTLTISGLSTYRMANITQVNNTGNSLTVAAGATVTNARRAAAYTTNTISTAGPGDSGLVTAYLNGTASGNVTLNGSSNGTYGNLIISANQDYHVANANITAGFWSVFSASLSGTGQPGWNDVAITDSAAGNTNAPSWYYDNSAPATPAFSSTSFAVSSNTVTYTSTVPHYTSATQFNIGFTVANVSGNMYPTSNTFVTGTAGGAFQAPVSVNYNQSSLASNVIPSFASATVSTTANIAAGFGSSASGPSVSVNNSYNTGTQAFTPGATVLYKTGTAGSLTFLDEGNLYVGGTIGAGVTGQVTRIVNPGSGDTPAYSGTEAAFNSQTGPLQTYDAAVVGGVLSCNKTNYSTGYLPVGPDLSTQDNTQYFTFKFVAPSTSKFDVYISGTIAGLYVALPGSGIDTSSTLNGWIDASLTYAGAGQPGAGTGGNGSNGCALGGVVPIGTLQTAKRTTCTFGTTGTAASTGNEVYVRIKLTTGQSITSLAIYPASN